MNPTEMAENVREGVRLAILEWLASKQGAEFLSQIENALYDAVRDHAKAKTLPLDDEEIDP